MTAPVAEPVARVLQRLPAARPVKSGEWRDRCPVHQGTSTTSLKLTAGHDGRALLHCFAGCPLETILTHLELTVADLFAGVGAMEESHTWQTPNGDSEPRGRIVATYDYRDAVRRLRFQTVRFAPKDFRQRQPDDTGAGSGA